PPSDREHLMGFPERCGSLEQVVAEAADTHQWLQVPRVLLAEVVDLLTCVPQAASFRGMGSLVEGDDGQAGVLHGDKGAEALFFKCGSNHEGNLVTKIIQCPWSGIRQFQQKYSVGRDGRLFVVAVQMVQEV